MRPRPGPSAPLRESERGAVLVFTGLLLGVLLIVAAIVIDLAMLRLDRRDDGRAADLSALAAASTLLVNSETATVGSCLRGWNTALANLPAASPIDSAPQCGDLSGLCSSATPPRSVSGTAGAYRITITHPVPDDSSYMTGTTGRPQPLNTAVDGHRCERIAVEVEHVRQLLFAGVTGTTTGTVRTHAVARALQGTAQQRSIALVLMERTACNGLRVEGEATVVVEESHPRNGVTSPGSIIVDSDASTCSGAYTIDAFGTATRIEAQSTADGRPGEIALRALPSGATTCSSPACEPVDVLAGRILPQPQPLPRRIGRTPVDHRYNCKPSYSLPAPWTGTVPGCTGSPATIDQLIASNQGAPGVAPSGHSTYPTDYPGGTCSLDSVTPAITLTGDWYINCPTFTVRNSFTITGNAVFEGTIDVTSSGHLTIGDGTTPRTAYLRNGSILKSGTASLTIDRASVYLHNGGINLQGGSGALTWLAPSSGSLAGLALWSESSSATHALAGKATNNVVGLLFTPNAGYGPTPNPFRISGEAEQVLLEAQLFTYRLLVTGEGILRIKAPAFVGIPLPDLEPRLIR